MGLDMYLTAKRYLWKDEDKAISEAINELVGVKADPKKRFNGSSLVAKGISLDAMYWRKANAIHGWFVDNCQDGVDDCRQAHVSREALIVLRDIVQRILNDRNLASELLPTQEGFFFGSTEYDEYYFGDLEETVRIIDDALSCGDEWTFAYQSSW